MMNHPHLRPFNVAVSTLLVIALLIVIKFVLHYFKLEFLSVNTLTGSALAGAIFICSFLLSGIIADYKEAEKIPTELRAALENIWDEAILFKQEVSKFNLEDTRKRLRNIVTSFFEGVSHAKGHAALEDCLKSVDDLSPIFSQMQKLGLLPNFLVRLKGEQGVIRRNVLRVFHIQKTQFIPSAYILAESIVALIVFVLLFIKTEGSPESFVLFGFISYMFVYIVRLIRRIEQPFQEGDSSLDDVSLFLLHDLETKFDSKDTRFQKVGS